MYLETELTSGFWTGCRLITMLASLSQIGIGMFLWASNKSEIGSLYATLSGWLSPELLILFESIVLCKYLEPERREFLFWGRWVVIFFTFMGAISAQVIYFEMKDLSYALLSAMGCWGLVIGNVFYEFLASTCFSKSIIFEDEEDVKLLRSE